MTGSRCLVWTFTRPVCLNSTHLLSPARIRSIVAVAAGIRLLLGSDSSFSVEHCVEVLSLLGHTDPVLSTGVALDVAEGGLGVVVRGELLELLLDPSSSF
jgi:hypothetical protein